MNYENELNKIRIEKKEIKRRSINKQGEAEDKFTQRKRRCKTPRKNKTGSDNEDEDLEFSLETKKSIKLETKPNSKRKNKRGMMEYVVPLRLPFKSSQSLITLIDKIITRYDPIQILRGYRDKLRNIIQFNDFSARRVEKILNLKNNLDNSFIYIDFNSISFNLVILKKEKMESQIKSDCLQNDKFPPVSHEKTTEISKFNLTENFEVNVESKMSNELVEKYSEENKISDNSLIQSNFENSSNYVNLNLLSGEQYEEIEKRFKDQIIEGNDLTDIDVLRYKAEMNYYTNIQNFVDDIKNMFRHIYNNLDNLLIKTQEQEMNEKNLSDYYKINNIVSNSDILAKIYLTAIFIEMMKLVDELKCNFKFIYDNDIKLLLENNKLPRVNIREFRNVPMKKEYQEIKEYEHIFPNRTKSKTASCIIPKCDGNCCKHFEDLGPLNLEKSRWDSICPDRMLNIECNPDICGCDINKCKNMAILSKTNKILGVDVIEKYSWGIDLYTYRNLIEFLPLNFSDEFKSEKFIEKTLLNACCDLDIKGYSLKKACEYLVNNSSDSNKKCFSQFENFFASHLLKVFKHSEIAKKNSSHAYSKGIGIFCLKPEGIKKNELIAPYLGEIYPPWYWYEKQDLIKKNKLDKVLPDFYNIMLERHKSDNKGYDLVMVDPNSKGNFASRMSHSCHPNCNTVLMSSGNEFTIGMYATKDICLGEELTFDYNSVTEKEKEFQDAICLCSSFNCRGHYLIYSNSNLFTEVISVYHTFLHRNSILVQACDLNFEKNSDKEMTEQDKLLLNKYAIRSSILENAPFWLRKWAALILRYIDFEANQLPIILSRYSKNEFETLNGNKNRKSEEMLFNELEESSFKIENVNALKKSCENDESELSTNNKKNKGKATTSSKKKFDFNCNFIFFDGVKKYESSSRRRKRSQNEINEKTSIDEEILTNKEKYIEQDEKILKDTEINKKSVDINEQKEKETKAKEIILDKMDVENYESIYQNQDKNDFKKLITCPIRNSHLNYELENCRMNISEEIKDSIADKPQSDFYQSIADEAITIENVGESSINLKEFINQVVGITENRIQNLAITMDKVIHVLKLMKTDKPPLVIINEKEVYEYYWGKVDSIKNNLLQNFNKIFKSQDFPSISIELTVNIQNILSILQNNYDDSKQNKNDYYLLNKLVRDDLRRISSICRNCKNFDKSNKFIFYEGLADILYLYSSTKLYFKHDDSYEKGAESELSFIRRRDISTTSTGENLDESIHKDRKYYDKLYVWGQLVGWYKQTVDKPNASLSAERRGTLSYPEIDSFFVYFDNFGKKAKNEVFKYPLYSRQSFFAKIFENPSQMWPVGNLWSYKNKNKIYGTVQFDSINLSRNPFDINQTKTHIINIFKNMNNSS